ncbi:MAG: GntG family PLP-dependent aldolase [Candidatus Dormibacteria bacterium]
MSEAPIDLRSDTFTLPDPAMRRAMADAEVGDDVWGEDPTVRRLEERVAGLLDKRAAVYVPSGTMGNLIGVLVHTRPGDEVVIDRDSHIAFYEVAGTAVVGGVQLRTLDWTEGVPTAGEVAAAVRTEDIHQPVSRLLCLENTHNRRGGLAVSAAATTAAAGAAHNHGLQVHCDGARLFNAAVALKTAPASLVAACDTVSVCLSKGLGAPVGSVLAGDSDAIGRARRWRKRLGGGMRQAGVIAAGALWALEHNVDRLAEDHANARRLAGLLSELPGIDLVEVAVPTNIVMLRTRSPAAEVADRARLAGVLLAPMGQHQLRATTHLGVDREAIEEVGRRLRAALDRQPDSVPA